MSTLATQDSVQDILLLDEYFDGRTYGWGIIEDRFGNKKSQFTMQMDGSWQNDIFILDEIIDYESGDKQIRQWRLSKNTDSTYEGEADDIIGKAHCNCIGNSIQSSYKLLLELGSKSIALDLEDTMYLQSDNVVINRIKMKKWGIKVAELSAFFTKSPVG